MKMMTITDGQLLVNVLLYINSQWYLVGLLQSDIVTEAVIFQNNLMMIQYSSTLIIFIIYIKIDLFPSFLDTSFSIDPGF